jgi:hypothetical protein
MQTKLIYCSGCDNKIEAMLVNGSTIYPHREDLWNLPFWQCPTCLNYVGCHHKTENRTRPLGIIPTPALRAARQHIHKVIDPLYKSGLISRSQLYKRISDEIGWKYHTANIKTLIEARKIWLIGKKLSDELKNLAAEKNCGSLR